MRQLSQRRNSSNKSQAISEMAVFGTLIIVAFAAVLSYLQSMNSQQSLEMQAFRKAIHRASAMNSEVTYTVVKDAPVVDVGDLFGRPDTTRQTASGNVFVAEHDDPPDDQENKAGRDSFEYYEVNNQGPFVIEPIQITNTYESGDPQKFWVAAPIADVQNQTTKQRTGNITKNETRGGISTTRPGNVNVQDTTILVGERQADYLRKALEDGQANAKKNSWERRYRNEQFVWQLKQYIYLVITTGIIHWMGTGVCGPDAVAKTAYIGAIGLLIEHVLGYLLNMDPPQGRLVSVSASGIGDRTVSGSRGFSEQQPQFNVSH